ncbi:MAG: hypothetical protein IJN54_06185 [Lachnospiraceae bacterium]|nr:hypothetical protein [Lachnospiraceae bacterium]
MSESVKIGGIGKNPAIDKINSLNSIDVKNYAVNKMEQLLLSEDFSEKREYKKAVSIDFSKANWKGESHGIKKERAQMAGSKLLKRADVSENSGRLEKTIRRDDREKISVQPKTAGDIRKFGGKQDINIQFVGKTVTREASLFGDFGNTKSDQSRLSGKYSGTGETIQNQGGDDGLVFIRHRGNRA